MLYHHRISTSLKKSACLDTWTKGMKDADDGRAGHAEVGRKTTRIKECSFRRAHRCLQISSKCP